MRRIRRQVWQEYLNKRTINGNPGPRRAATDSALIGFARSLASYVVACSNSPYPYLEEDKKRLISSPIGVPAPPGSLPGGVLDESAKDAGVGGPLVSISKNWRVWNPEANQHAKYARFIFKARDDQELKLATLSREARLPGPVVGHYNGHPLVVLVAKYWTPVDVYLTLTASSSFRNSELEKVIRSIEQDLCQGEKEFERACKSEDWDTLRPILESAKWILFPKKELTSKSSLEKMEADPLHDLCSEIIEDMKGWSIGDGAAALIIVVSLAATFVSMGTMGALAAIALRATLLLDVIGIGAELVIADAENQRRSRINRFVAIDRALSVASKPESLGAKALFGIACLLMPCVLPPALRSAKKAFLDRVLPKIRSGGAQASQAASKATRRQSTHQAGNNSVDAVSRGTTEEPGAATPRSRGTDASSRSTLQSSSVQSPRLPAQQPHPTLSQVELDDAWGKFYDNALHNEYQGASGTRRKVWVYSEDDLGLVPTRSGPSARSRTEELSGLSPYLGQEATEGQSQALIREYERLTGGFSPPSHPMDNCIPGKLRGSFFASHAEVQSVIVHRSGKGNIRIGVTKSMCYSCREFCQQAAKTLGRRIEVTDGNFTRVFNTDGSVDIYVRGNTKPIRRVSPGVPPSVSPYARSRHSDVPW